MNAIEIATPPKSRDLLWLIPTTSFLLMVLFTVQGSVEVSSTPGTSTEVLIDGKPARAFAPGIHRSSRMLIGSHTVTVRTAGRPEWKTTAFAWLSQRVVVSAVTNAVVPAVAPLSTSAGTVSRSAYSRIETGAMSGRPLASPNAEPSGGDTAPATDQAEGSLSGNETTRSSNRAWQVPNFDWNSEDLVVSARSSQSVISKPLEAGGIYELEVTGTYDAWGDTPHAVDAVACFANPRCNPSRRTKLAQGFRVDDRGLIELSGGTLSYRDDHTYHVTITGAGRPLQFYINDARTSAGDNVGEINVHLARRPAAEHKVMEAREAGQIPQLIAQDVEQGEANQTLAMQILPGKWYFKRGPGNNSKCIGCYIEIEAVSQDGSVSGAFKWPSEDTSLRFDGSLQGTTVELFIMVPVSDNNPNGDLKRRRFVGTIDFRASTISGEAQDTEKGHWRLRGGWLVSKN